MHYPPLLAIALLFTFTVSQEQMITDTRIGIRMWDTFIATIEPLEGLSYRSFERAVLNSRGAFYRAKLSLPNLMFQTWVVSYLTPKRREQ
jgi:hypothetical protein